MNYFLNKILKSSVIGFFIGFGFIVGVLFFVKAASLTATTGEPLTVSKWTDMAANFFWGSGSGGIYYNGKVGIGTNSPNKSLHIKTTAGTNAELDLQSGDLPHWAIYQDESTKSLAIRNGVIRTSISTGGNLNAQGLCINGVCKTNWNQISGGGFLNYTGTCDSAHKGATGIISGMFKVCNGIVWTSIVSAQNFLPGTGTDVDPYRLSGESATASSVVATSCNYYNMNVNTTLDGLARGSGTCGGGSKECLSSGVYRINPLGGTNAFNVYCDMSTDGGGWTLVVGINSADKNHHGAAEYTPLNLVSLTGKGKYSDSLINSIRTLSISEKILKLVCNGTVDYFDYRSTVWHATFTANPNGLGWDVYTQPWGTAPNTGGGSSYPNNPGMWSYSNWGNTMIYGYVNSNGCYNGAARGNNGTVWLR